MPEPVEGNVPGKYYISEDCAGCQVCVDIAPDNIEFDDDSGYAIIAKQPENDEEVELMEDAIDSCPSEAICDDGQE